MRKDSYRYIFWSSCAAILEIFYAYGLYEDIGAFINKNTANVEEYLDSKAQTRAPEDPEHPDRPITSQIKNDKRGRRRMIKETKEQGEKKKNTSGAHWDIHFHKIEPRWDWAHVQRHYKGTWGANDLFSLLGACSNWGFTGGYEGWRSQYDLHLNNQITLNWIIEIGKNYVWFLKKKIPLKWIKSGWFDHICQLNTVLLNSEFHFRPFLAGPQQPKAVTDWLSDRVMKLHHWSAFWCNFISRLGRMLPLPVL